MAEVAHGPGGKWSHLSLYLPCATPEDGTENAWGGSKLLPNEDTFPAFLPQRWVNSFKCISFLWLVSSCLLPSGSESFDIRPYTK